MVSGFVPFAFFLLVLRGAKAASARPQGLEELADSISRNESVLRVFLKAQRAGPPNIGVKRKVTRHRSSVLREFLKSAKAAPARPQGLEELVASISRRESVLRVFLRSSASPLVIP